MIDLAVLISEIEQELALLQELIIQIQQLQKLIQKSEKQDIRNGLVNRVLELAQKLVDVSEYLLQDCQQFCVELRSFGQNQDIQS